MGGSARIRQAEALSASREDAIRIVPADGPSARSRRVARDTAEDLKFYAAKPRKRRQSASSSHSGLRVRQRSAPRQSWAGEATSTLQYG